MMEWPLDPFLVRENDCKLNFVPLKHLFIFYLLFTCMFQCDKRYDGLSHVILEVCIHFAF